MRFPGIQTLKKLDDALEILVFDWALHPSRRARTLAVTALAGALAFQYLGPGTAYTPEEAFERGTALLAKKAKAPEAIRLLEGASGEMATDPRVWQNLGHAYLAADREGDALTAYTRAVALDDSAAHLFFLAYAYVKADLPEAAMGLYDQILIKDNHIDYAGSVQAAVGGAHRHLASVGTTVPVVVEVRDLDEVRAALEAGGVDRLLLDNFSPAQAAEAVAFIAGRIPTEASGGLTPDTVRAYGEAGVDFVSLGWLTHSPVSLDISLKSAAALAALQQ